MTTANNHLTGHPAADHVTQSWPLFGHVTDTDIRHYIPDAHLVTVAELHTSKSSHTACPKTNAEANPPAADLTALAAAGLLHFQPSTGGYRTTVDLANEAFALASASIRHLGKIHAADIAAAARHDAVRIGLIDIASATGANAGDCQQPGGEAVAGIDQTGVIVWSRLLHPLDT